MSMAIQAVGLDSRRVTAHKFSLFRVSIRELVRLEAVPSFNRIKDSILTMELHRDNTDHRNEQIEIINNINNRVSDYHHKES
jgi:hypothetical protein